MKRLAIVAVKREEREEREENRAITVEFSDGTCALFTAEELAGIRRFRMSETAERSLFAKEPSS